MPLSGTIPIASSSGEVVTLASNTNDVNMFSLFGSPAGIGTYILTVNSGVVIGSTSSSTAAMTIGSFAVGSTVRLINNGSIEGEGGTGGVSDGGAGGVGGNALDATVAIEVFNNDTIAGGGGGGGGHGNNTVTGGGGHSDPPCEDSAGGAGGKGAGSGNAAAGNGGTLGATGSNGSAGSGPCGGDPGGSGGAPGNYAINASNIDWIVTGTRLGGVSA